MSDAVEPETAEEVSPAVAALRKEVSWLQNAVFALGSSTIRAKEGQQAHEILTYLDGLAAAKCKELDSLIATEMLGKPVVVDGTKISMPETVSH